MRFGIIFSILSGLFLSGCARGSGEAAQSSRLARVLQDIGGAPAVASVADSMRLFFFAGLAFVVLGGLWLCLGGGKGGATLLGMGAAVTSAGVVLVQYPWAALLLTLTGFAAAAFIAYRHWRTKRELVRNQEALAATAQVIQNLPEGEAIKRGLSSLGTEIEEKVRTVVTPIKERLRREGRIETGS